MCPKPPYVASVDADLLNKYEFNHEKLELRLELLPVPYIGNLDKAAIVLLCLNPGFDETLDVKTSNDPLHNEENIKALSFSSSPPFFYFNPKLSYSGGYKWWSRLLKDLISEFGVEILSEKLMCLQYVAYHSKVYTDLPFILPSQRFNFHLLEQAMNARKIIVIMRSKRYWIRAVPRLANYPYVELKNYRNPYLTKNNVKTGDFQKIREAIK